MTTPESGTRRAARRAQTRARRARLVRAGLFTLALTGVVVLIVALPRLLAGAPTADAPAQPAVVRPPVAQSLPVPAFPATRGICEDPAVQAALAAGDDEGAIAAAGGGAVFRTAVATGTAPCISLSDPAHRWVVVNKTRPLEPIDATPATLVMPAQVRSLSGGNLRADAAEALDALRAGAQAAGAGDVAMLSGFRSYNTQVSTYAQHVASDGRQQADLESARPGYSEHQTGLTLDLVACDRGCGDLDGFGGSAQGAWVAEHAWEYGFIVRYEDGATGVTGYKPEPWHLRFIGLELAREYREGGWRTLEEFFGLPPAPDYLE